MKRALLVPPLLLLGACGGSSTPAPSPSAPPPSASPVVVSPSPSPSAPARSAASPSPSRRVRAAPGDVDGDGKADTVTVTSTTLTVKLTGGGTVTAPITDTDVPKPVVSGIEDLDLDGRAEVWVETARGASTSFVQAYRYDGSKLRELTFDGAHIRFGIGGSVTHGDGFACTDAGRLVVSTAESDDGTSYRLRTRTFRVSGATLVLVSQQTATATSMEDPRVHAAYQVDCGSVGESD